METWKPVPGYEGNYEVSDMGRVRTLRRGIGVLLKPGRSSNGYLSVCLSKDGKRQSVLVQVLVATAFIGPRPSPYHCCLHADDCRTNNHLGNLRWGSKSDNSVDRYRLAGKGLKLTFEAVAKIRLALVNGPTETERIGKEFGVSGRTVRYIRQGLRYVYVTD